MSRNHMLMPLLVSALLLATPADAVEWRVRADGFGPVHVGMTRLEAERASGIPMSDDRALSASFCYYLDFTRRFKGIIFMVTEGRISRVDVLSRDYATVSGARVGDTEAQLKALYGERARFEPHKYLGAEGSYVMVRTNDNRYAVQFETKHGHVFRYRAGKFPEVGLVEGCN